MGDRYFNSIITTHGNRLGSMRALLGSLSIAAEEIDKDSFEIVITNLDPDPKADEMICGYRDKLNIKHCKINYQGLFWKTKALNHCILNAEGEYITMVDIDAVVPPLFLKHIQGFYAEPANRRVKLCHRVRFLDPSHSKHLTKKRFDKQYLQSLIGKHKKFRLAFERYTKEEIKTRSIKTHEKKWMDKQALGNSHYTMRREDILAIGGYDERFIGWSCEDLDFNRRAFAYLGAGHIDPVPIYTIFSVHHNRAGWMNRKNTIRNENLYRKNKKENIIKLPINDTWGKF